MSPEEDIMHMHALPLRTEAVSGHTVRGLTNNLDSTRLMTRNGYIPTVQDDKISIYDAQNTTITVSRAVVLGGWYVPHERLWRIPLVKNVTNIKRQTAIVNESPPQLL